MYAIRSYYEKGGDPELAELARLEIEDLKEQKEEMENELKSLLVPKDPNDNKDVIMEIRVV